MLVTRRRLIAGTAASLLLPPTAFNALSATPPAEGWVSIRDHGALGDGFTIDTPAIDRAIGIAAERGGGTVYFPAGVYASYTVHLRSNITLHLDAGATLLAAERSGSAGYDSAEPQDPASGPYQDYGHNHWRNSLIYGEDLHDISIVGDGLIWGRGLVPDQPDPQIPGGVVKGDGNKAIGLKNCRNVLLRDLSMLKCGHFALLATGVDNLTIDNLLVDTDRDGLDVDCCRNVRITGCTVNAPIDDGICLKSSLALGHPRPTENVTISDCYVTGQYLVGTLLDGSYQPYVATIGSPFGRIKFGTESNGGFRNIAITNCVFENCQGLTMSTVDGGDMEDVVISNITMRGINRSPLFIRLGARLRGPKGTRVGVARRILIDNLTSSGGSPLPAIIAGIADHPVADVRLSNIFLESSGGGDAELAQRDPPEQADGYPEASMFGALPATGLFIRHAREVELSHVEIRILSRDARPAFWLEHVVGFDGVGIDVPDEPKAFSLRNVSQFRLAESRSVPPLEYDGDTTTVF